MKAIQRVWQEIRSGQNVDIYVTFFVAIAVAVLGVFSVTHHSIILSAILAVLALLSTNLLSIRRESEAIRNTILQIQTPENSTERFLTKEYQKSDVQKAIHSARKAFFWGMTFTRTIPFLKDDIAKALQEGFEIRILILKQFSESVNMAAFRNTYTDANGVNFTLQYNLSLLSNIAARDSKGKLEVRVVNYLPPYTCIAFDPHLSSGRMFVRLLPFRVPDEMRPTFTLTRLGDEMWFNFFVEQFEAIWKAAEPVDLSAGKWKGNIENATASNNIVQTV